MATYSVKLSSGVKVIEADDWRVESDFVIFFKKPTRRGTNTPSELRVYAAKTGLVYHIEIKEE
jgi:hypothetical protein